MSGVPFGVYVHVPFCTVRCDYCDFATWDDRAHLIDDYVDACVADLGRRSADVPVATSVFLGGGTPSLLTPRQVERLLDAIDREAGAEVTIEANPDTVDATRLAGFRDAGVNRVSIGVQSTRPHVLGALGRTHRPEHVQAAVAAAFDVGIDRVGVDLIYGAAGATLDDWRRTLDDALALGVGHVSAYALTVEAGTPLAARIASGEVVAPDEDLQADEYVIADEVLIAAGLTWYEISNWARPGHECTHNILCWQQGDYLGVGCAAHSHSGGRRWWNVRTPERYVQRVRAGESPEAGSEVLGDAERAEEAFVLALRTSAGAPVAPAAQECAADLADAGLLVSRGGRAVLTTRGRLLASDVTARLLLAGAAAEEPSPGAAAQDPAGTRYH